MSIPRISSHDLTVLLAGGGPLTLIDVRTPKEFAACHVQGATSLPLDQVTAPAVAALRRGPGPVYLLCQTQVRATAAAERLAGAGMTEVVIVEGGTSACIQAAVPVVRSGAAVFSLERQLRTVIGLGVCAGAALAWFVHPAWIGLSAFFGAGLVFAGLTDICPLGLFLARMPWNRAPAPASSPVPNCCA